MHLLVDMGNSRIKWAECWEKQLHNPAEAGDIQLLASMWREIEQPSEVWISSVVNKQRNRLIETLCQDFWQVSPRFAQTQRNAYGLRIAYDNPERLGVDRWLAMIAVRQSTDSPSLVVDCGTAVTLDAVDSRGRHQGGLIAPGLHMMWNTLFAQTHIPDEQQVPFSGELGKDTPECAAAGILYSICGLIERTHYKLTHEWGQAPRLIMTGGDARNLSQQLSCPLEVRPLLVMEGLAALRD